jgi:hypothetical protein
MLILKGSERFADVSGPGGHRENQLRIVTAQTLISTHTGDVIAVFHQKAFLGKAKNIYLVSKWSITMLRSMTSLFGYQG